jgi:hypothetical protein
MQGGTGRVEPVEWNHRMKQVGLKILDGSYMVGSEGWNL